MSCRPFSISREWMSLFRQNRQLKWFVLFFLVWIYLLRMWFQAQQDLSPLTPHVCEPSFVSSFIYVACPGPVSARPKARSFFTFPSSCKDEIYVLRFVRHLWAFLFSASSTLQVHHDREPRLRSRSKWNLERGGRNGSQRGNGANSFRYRFLSSAT